jgi:hypothetical protein
MGQWMAVCVINNNNNNNNNNNTFHQIKRKEAEGLYSPIKMLTYSIRKTGIADIAWEFHELGV